MEGVSGIRLFGGAHVEGVEINGSRGRKEIFPKQADRCDGHGEPVSFDATAESFFYKKND